MNNIKNALQGTPAVSTEGVATLDSIASREEFDKAIAEGRIRASQHPEYPYVILKYTQSTQFNKDWDDITMASRGLIFNTETNEIVARPFRKFFNYSEGLTPEEDLTGPFVVAEKLDGSLGISFRNPNGEMEITTAGGFRAPQGAHATRIYRERYDGNWEPHPDRTYLYEIIYPENRIVVDYKGEDDIYLLGAVNKRTGKSIPLSQITEWKWKRASEYTEFKDLNDVVNAPDPGIEHEGYIVHFTKTDARVKFKHEEYLKVHRLSTGINERRIHEMLSSGMDSQLDEFQKVAPEEFESYIKETRAKLQAQYAEKVAEIENSYASLRASLPENVERKDFALAVQQLPQHVRSHMFNKYLGRPLNTKSIWESFTPPHEEGFWAAGNGREDN
jgi:RNA ligase